MVHGQTIYRKGEPGVVQRKYGAGTVKVQTFRKIDTYDWHGKCTGRNVTATRFENWKIAETTTEKPQETI